MTKRRMPEIHSDYNNRDHKDTNEGKINSRICKAYPGKKYQLDKIQPVQMGIFTQFEDSDKRAKCYKHKKTLKSFWV